MTFLNRDLEKKLMYIKPYQMLLFTEVISTTPWWKFLLNLIFTIINRKWNTWKIVKIYVIFLCIKFSFLLLVLYLGEKIASHSICHGQKHDTPICYIQYSEKEYFMWILHKFLTLRPKNLFYLFINSNTKEAYVSQHEITMFRDIDPCDIFCPYIYGWKKKK